MRTGVFLFAAVLSLTVGCAKQRPGPTVSQQRQQAELRYAERGGGSLAFDPPVTADNPQVNLWRDRRQASVFMGFEQMTTTFSYVRWDDRQTEDSRNDRFERRAVSETYGTSWR